MIKVTSSPMRFERFQGLYVVTCLNLADAATGDHLGSMHKAESRTSFSDAKRVFWESWKEEMEGYFLSPRASR